MLRYRSRPVPAGISLPKITFSLSPTRESDLAWMAASVNTLVVSWKDAADNHDSVASDAFVIPTARHPGLRSHRRSVRRVRRPVGCLPDRVELCLACRRRNQIVTCSGVVVRDGGTVTGIGLRIASASAAVVVSAAVAGAALYGGSAISDPGSPGRDDRLVAVPAAPSAYLSETPSPTPKATTSSGGSRTQLARPHSRPHKCNIHQQAVGAITP